MKLKLNLIYILINSKCGCGKLVTDHDPKYQRDGQFANEWLRDHCTIEDGPTDAYGSISFDNERISQVTKFKKKNI